MNYKIARRSKKITRIKWWGHAGFQITTKNVIAFIDLYQAKKYKKLVGEPSDKADLILITHHHSDHCHKASIKHIQTFESKIIAPQKCKSKISGSFQSLTPGDELTHAEFQIKAVEAYNITHLRHTGKPWHPKGLGVGYLIRVKGKTIYHAGDTDLIPEMSDLGPVDLALLPTGDTFTMDNLEAAEATLRIQPKTAFSMHRWDTDPTPFKEQVESRTDVKVIIPNEGEEIDL